MLSTEISDVLLKGYGHYVQAINYPTVARGEERLRVAPTPHHTTEMMDKFVEDLTVVWQQIGLPLRPRTLSTNQGCPRGGATCHYCEKPLLFQEMEARVKAGNPKVAPPAPAFGCKEINCPQLITATA